MMTGNLNGGGRGGGEGPCGACKFLRRKCVKGCVFAPYFDAEQGTARFAAVHKVFGASNASKMLLRLPLHKRLDAVVTLCYEALARLRDPVYGSVGHLFSLQHQVMNLQAELAHVQARLSTFQRFPQQMQQPPFDVARNNEYPMEASNLDVVWEEEHVAQAGIEDGEFQELTMQFVSSILHLLSKASTSARSFSKRHSFISAKQGLTKTDSGGPRNNEAHYVIQAREDIFFLCNGYLCQTIKPKGRRSWHHAVLNQFRSRMRTDSIAKKKQEPSDSEESKVSAALLSEELLD